MLEAKKFTRDQVRAIDQLIISKGTPGYSLMQRAGEAAFNVLLSKWPQAKQVLIFCGLGNNAGDGYVLAKILALHGINVQVVQVGDANNFTGEALTAYEDSLQIGIKPLAWDKDSAYSADIIVDALIGTGLNKPLLGDFATAVTYINNQKQPILALDIPSGLDANTGEPLGNAVKANVTVTFIAYKQGLFNGLAGNYTGEIILADLGIKPSDYAELGF